MHPSPGAVARALCGHHAAERRRRTFASIACVAALLACERREPPPPAQQQPPPRVWSLTPELSALLVELGVAGSVTAADRASLALPELAYAADLGPGGENALALVDALRPERAILLGDARGLALAQALTERGIATTVLAPRSANEVIEAVQRLGALLQRETRAAALAAHISNDVARVATRRDGQQRLVAAWLLARDPPVVVGASGLLHELLELAGAENAVHGVRDERVALSAELLTGRPPELLLDSTGAAPNAPEPPPLHGTRRVPVPAELAALPALDLVERVERLHALLYP